MMDVGGRVRRLILGISTDETRLERRGFADAEPAVRQRLEQIGATFVEGYHHALDEPDADRIAPRLDAIDAERRGWAYEGAAMALGLLDGLTPWRRDRFRRLLSGPGDAHAYMLHVGLGWSAARLHRRIEPMLPKLDPLLGWLVVDGLGFHQGYFHWPKYVDRKLQPRRLRGYARRVFDQGLGRSLWFVKGARVETVRGAIAEFAESRRADLWSGVGLACAYAGGVDRPTVEQLAQAAGDSLPHLAQGAAFAAKARRRAGTPSAMTEMACAVLCGCGIEEAAAVTDEVRATLAGAKATPDTPAYELWRRGIRRRFAPQEVAA